MSPKSKKFAKLAESEALESPRKFIPLQPGIGRLLQKALLAILLFKLHPEWTHRPRLRSAYCDQPAMPSQVYHQWKGDDPEAFSDNLGMAADRPLQDCYDFGGNPFRMHTSHEFKLVEQ